MQFRQECSNGLADQVSITWREHFCSGLVGQFDESPFINSDNCSRAGLYQYPNATLGILTQAPVAQNLSRQQSAAAKGQSLKSQSDTKVCRVEIAELFAQKCAADPQQHDAPPRHIAGDHHDGEKIKKP